MAGASAIHGLRALSRLELALTPDVASQTTRYSQKMELLMQTKTFLAGIGLLLAVTATPALAQNSGQSGPGLGTTLEGSGSTSSNSQGAPGAESPSGNISTTIIPGPSGSAGISSQSGSAVPSGTPVGPIGGSAASSTAGTTNGAPSGLGR